MKISLFLALAAMVGADERINLANNKYAQRLLQTAKVIEEPDRRLADQKNGLDYGSMYLKYEGCSSYQDYAQNGYWNNANNQYYGGNYNRNGNYNGGNYYNNGGNRKLQNYNYNNQKNQQGQDGGMNLVNLVRFTLCFTNSCSSCTGKYAADMTDFLLAYQRHVATKEEIECKSIQEDCVCNGNYNNYNNGNNQNQGNDYQKQQCYNSCYKQAGKSSCIETYDSDGQLQEKFDLYEYLQCKEMDYYPAGYAYYQVNKQYDQAGYYYDPNDQNNYGNDGVFYVGPYCKDANEIYLGTFLDNACSYAATHATFKSKYQGKNGEAFPYFKAPIISAGSCLMCQDEEQYYQGEKQKYEAQQQYQYQNYQYQAYYEQAQQNNQEHAVNGLCAIAAKDGGDSTIRCTNDDYEGCLFLEMLPDLDGRNAARFSAASAKLDWEKNYTVVLGVLAGVLGMAILVLVFCDPTAIPEKKKALLNKMHLGRGKGFAATAQGGAAIDAKSLEENLPANEYKAPSATVV